MYRVRNETVAGENVLTRYGLTKLDSLGFVTNLDELGCTAEELLTVPGFIDNEDFPHPYQPVTENSELPKEDLVAALIDGLISDEANLNSAGKLDLKKLNDEFAKQGLPQVKGKERDALVAKYS